MKRILLILALLLSVDCFGQSAASPLMTPRMQFFDASGNPIAFGKIYTYIAGTSLPQATFTDSTGTVANANPVLLDAGGYASIYVKCSTAPYKIVVKDALLVTIYTEDGVQYPGCAGTNTLFTLNGLTGDTQDFATGTDGNDFNIVSDINTHTFNIPDATATARGFVSMAAQIIAGPKTLTGSTLIDNDLYTTGHVSTDHPVEITAETCGTAEASVGLIGFDPVTSLPCWSFDGSTPSSSFLGNNIQTYTGAQTTRDTVRAEVGLAGAVGSTYQSTAGKMYLKVANADATTDWQRVTATAAD